MEEINGEMNIRYLKNRISVCVKIQDCTSIQCDGYSAILYKRGTRN